MANQLDVIRERLLSADADHPGWSIQGHASKRFLGFENPALERLSLKHHEGVVDYWPDELIIRVRAGTALSDIDQVLEANQQRMIFEAPRVNGQGTIGGAVAAGLSGPRPLLAGRFVMPYSDYSCSAEPVKQCDLVAKSSKT